MNTTSQHLTQPAATTRRGVKTVPQPALALLVPSALLTRATVRALTGFSDSSLARQMRHPTRPFPEPAARFNRSPRWRAAEVLAWLDSTGKRDGQSPRT